MICMDCGSDLIAEEEPDWSADTNAARWEASLADAFAGDDEDTSDQDDDPTTGGATT